MNASLDPAQPHTWIFRKVGKTYQVQLRTVEDLKHLRELDPKLWVALSCPVDGLEIDPKSLALIDSDGDGRVRMEEVLAAVDWTLQRLIDPSVLFRGGNLPIAAIRTKGPRGKPILAAARQILDASQNPESKEISVADAANTAVIFAHSMSNGDGIIALDAISEPDLEQTFKDIVQIKGPTNDRSGQPGIDLARLNDFFGELRAYAQWWTLGETKGRESKDFFPLGIDTPAAFQALAAVEQKMDDYFGRCRLAAFDKRAETALNREAALFESVAKEDLSVSRREIAELPLGRVSPRQELALDCAINPEWADRLKMFRTSVSEPLNLEGSPTLSWEQWRAVRALFDPYRSWQGAKPVTGVESLGMERIRQLLGSDHEGRLRAILAEELSLAGQANAVGEVEKLARMHRDLVRLLRNFVNFEDFYGAKEGAVFQAGTLYLDGRECRLCLKVADPAKHAPLGTLSRAFLAYCDCRRKDSPEKFFIAAVFSAGDSAHLLVGRNGVFQDRSGKLWDSTVVRIVENPIGIREAFFMPYVRLGRFINEQLEKWAISRDLAIQQRMETTATQAGPKKKSEYMGPLGGFAAMLAAGGIAIGAIGAGVGTLFRTLSGVPYWELPLFLIGIMLLISLPSMFIAWMRLRKRTLAPLLDAAGWAVNGRTHISFRLGRLLTRRAVLPCGASIEIAGRAVARARFWVLLGLTFLASVLVRWLIH